MSFTTMGAGAFAAGLAGIVVATFLLQRLRVRHRPVRVVTTLFWRDAVEDARARILTSRFRHPWAWLFIVALCAMLWAGFANPRSETATSTSVVYLVDLSARATAPGRVDALLDTLSAEIAATPADGRQVFAVTDRLVPLLRPGEGSLVLDRRVKDLTAVAAPSSTAHAARLIAGATRGEREIRIVSGRSFSISEDDLEGARLSFIAPAEGPVANKRGITALGVTAAASGRWDRVDALFTLVGAGLADVSASVDGAPVADIDAMEEEGVYVIRDLAAQGGLLEIAVPSTTGLAADDQVAMRLPRRRPIRVMATADVPPVLGVVLTNHPAVSMSDTDPDVVVATSVAATADRPGLVITGATPSIIIAAPTAAEAGRLRDTLRAVGFDEIGPVSPGTTAAPTITTSIGACRLVTLSPALLGERYDLLASRAFPLAVSSMLLWLADADDVPTRFAAGEAVVGASAVHTDDRGRRLDPIGGSFVPPAAGRFESGDDTVVASLLDPSLIDASVVATPDDERRDGDAPTDPLLILALLAFAGLLAEWFLFRTQRMP